MSYLHRKFVWMESHPETGSTGWIAPDMIQIEGFLPGGGLTVAHDTLEHFALDGTTEDELLAFGQLWYIRGDTDRINDYARNFRSREDVFASDIAEIFRSTHYADLKPCRAPVSENLEFIDDHWKEVVWKHFDSTVRAEDRDWFEAPELSDRTEKDVKDFEKYVRAWFDTAINWMRRGYLKARRRWNSTQESLSSGYASYEAADLFWQIAKEIDAEHMDEEVGMYKPNLSVIINIKRRSYNIVQTA